MVRRDTDDGDSGFVDTLGLATVFDQFGDLGKPALGGATTGGRADASTAAAEFSVGRLVHKSQLLCRVH